MSDMNVRKIVRDYLVANGYDGLCSSWEPCGCELVDLMPCGCGVEDCVPGYKGPCDCEEGCDWHMVEEKSSE